MKAVQIGILAALVVCAGLLFKVYRGQSGQPTPQPVQAATAPPAPAPAPAAMPEIPAATPVATPVESKPAETPAAAPAKPSPTRPFRRKSEPAAGHREPERAAAATSSSPAPAAVPVAQTSTPPAPAAEPAPAPAAPTPALNPPAGTQTAPPPPRVPHTLTIPAGTMVSIRLSEALSSDRNKPGDSFAASLDQPIVVDGFAIAERSAKVQGKVIEAMPAGRVKGVSSLAIQLTRLHTADGQEVNLQTETFRKEGPNTRADDAKKIGVGAAIGAAIGAIAGGGKGAAIGAGVGGAAGTGTVMATRGKPSELPVETRISFRLQEPITITERLQ